MSQPLLELRRLLSDDAPGRGRVVRVAGTRVEVATARGQLTCQAGGSLRVGQEVTLAGGVAYPRAAATDVYAV